MGQYSLILKIDDSAVSKNDTEHFISILSKIGMKVDSRENKEKNETDLFITFDDSVDKRITRNAGKQKTKTYMTVGEIRGLREKGVSAETLAETLGMSRSTFFRRWKNADGMPDEELF